MWAAELAECCASESESDDSDIKNAQGEEGSLKKKEIKIQEHCYSVIQQCNKLNQEKPVRKSIQNSQMPKRFLRQHQMTSSDT